MTSTVKSGQGSGILTGVLRYDGRDDVFRAIDALKLSGDAVEIGVFGAVFSEQILSRAPFRKLYCVDPYLAYDEYKDGINYIDFEAKFKEAKRRVERFGARVEFKRKFSLEASRDFADGSLDFVYIDGNHQYKYVKEDLTFWYPKVKIGGLIVGDDAHDVDDSRRNADGDVEWVHSFNADGTKASWGFYGVVKAAREFAEKSGLKLHLSGGQFLIVKE
jgi:hypothetical protein